MTTTNGLLAVPYITGSWRGFSFRLPPTRWTYEIAVGVSWVNIRREFSPSLCFVRSADHVPGDFYAVFAGGFSDGERVRVLRFAGSQS